MTRRGVGAWVVVLVLGAGSARADVPALTEHDAIARALGRAPLADVVEGAVEVEQGRARAARARPNPELAYAREQTFGAAGTADTYLSISQSFDLAGRRGLRGDAIALRAEAARRDGDALRLAISADVRQRFYELLYRQARVMALARWVAHVDDALAIVARREQRGDAATYDRTRFERERAVTAARLATEQAEVARAATRLRAIVGDPEPRTVAGSLLPDGDPPDAAALRTASAARPDLVALDLQARAAARDRAAEERWWWPDLTLELGWKGVAIGAGGRSDGYIAGAAITVPLWDRAAGARQMADGEARAARGRRALLASEVDGQLEGARAEAVRLRQVATEFEARAGTTSRELLHMTTVGYEAGELGVIELLDAYRGATDDELLALDMDLAARRARIELDRLTGAKLP